MSIVSLSSLNKFTRHVGRRDKLTSNIQVCVYRKNVATARVWLYIYIYINIVSGSPPPVRCMRQGRFPPRPAAAYSKPCALCGHHGTGEGARAFRAR